MWHRSTDEGSVTGAPLLLGAGVVVAVAIAVVAGLVAYGHGKGKPQPSAVNAVKTAYFAYSAASVQELDQLSLDPLRPYLTAAGAAQEQAILDNVRKTGAQYRVTLDHDPQIVVYSPTLASVDDLLVRHTTEVFPTNTTLVDVLHMSYALANQNGHWLIDSVVPFGTGAPEQGFSLSYAAASREHPIGPSALQGARHAYDEYWASDTKALSSLDAGPLGGVEEGPLLQQDQALIQSQQQKGQGYRIVVAHNARFAQQDDKTLWVYDTYSDASYPFDISSGRATDRPTAQIVRQSYEFKLVDGTWKLEVSTEFK